MTRATRFVPGNLAPIIVSGPRRVVHASRVAVCLDWPCIPSATAQCNKTEFVLRPGIMGGVSSRNFTAGSRSERTGSRPYGEPYVVRHASVRAQGWDLVLGTRRVGRISQFTRVVTGQSLGIEESRHDPMRDFLHGPFRHITSKTTAKESSYVELTIAANSKRERGRRVRAVRCDASSNSKIA